jgi:hypothetical protein
MIGRLGEPPLPSATTKLQRNAAEGLFTKPSNFDSQRRLDVPRVDFFTGLALVGLAVGVFIGTLDMAKVERGIGPGDYPRVAAWGLLFLGALLTIQSGLKLVRRQKQPLPFPPGAFPRVFTMVLMTFAYIYLMPYTGFVLITPVYLFLAMLFFGLRRYRLGILTSLSVTLVLFLTFRYAFQVLLPILGLFDLI